VTTIHVTFHEHVTSIRAQRTSTQEVRHQHRSYLHGQHNHGVGQNAQQHRIRAKNTKSWMLVFKRGKLMTRVSAENREDTMKLIVMAAVALGAA
jgi:hypothetical protein